MYFYPDDVIITVVDGKRTARLGMTVVFDPVLGVSIKSELPVIYTGDEPMDTQDNCIKAWVAARERYRHQQSEIFLSGYPMIVEEREAQAAWDAAGRKWSVSAFAEWYDVRKRIRKKDEPWL